MNNEQHAQDLLSITQQMIALVDTENQLLQKQQVQQVIPLQPMKNKLFQAYEQHVTAFQQAPEQLSSLPADVKEALRATLAKFESICTVNRRALKSARDSRRFVLNAIREAAIAEQRTVSSYTQAGKNRPAAMQRYAGQAMPVALDERL